MSYLLSHLPRPAGSPPPGARIDLLHLLNRPGHFADAHIRAYVEDTSGRTLRRWRSPPAPRIELEITDCINEIHLEFDLSTPAGRENSLFKIDTLLDALAAFRSAVAAEAELYEQRESELASRRRLRRRVPLHT
jgi:hypothetical protein